MRPSDRWVVPWVRRLSAALVGWLLLAAQPGLVQAQAAGAAPKGKPARPAASASAPAPAPVAGPSPYAEKFATTCAPCHGERGMSTLALVPHLAGQPSFYAITQLFLFRDGRRDNALMSAVAKGMSDADLRAYSDLIGRLPWVGWPSAVADGAAAASTQDANQFMPQPVPARMARGAALAQRLHCTGCHGADLAGAKQVPRLAGQREDYLAQALAGFRSATRVGYSPAMTEALAGTQADELDDLAHYLAHFPTGDAAAAAPPAGR